MAKQNASLGQQWYAIHTHSGCEENVVENLKERIKALDMEDKIFDVLVPTEKKIKMKNGKRKVVTEKIYPGYVLVHMLVTDDSWYVVRNTPNVTGFVGSGTTPPPLSQTEVDDFHKRMGQEEPKFKIDISEGTAVTISDGPFKGFDGKVSEVDEGRGKVKILVNMFGRETPVELDFLQVTKI